MSKEQLNFDTLVQDDFIQIAENAAEHIINGRCKGRVLVNCSQPDVMCFDPVSIPEYKHMNFEIGGENDTTYKILVMIGKE
jgi:hypothetical protein